MCYLEVKQVFFGHKSSKLIYQSLPDCRIRLSTKMVGGFIIDRAQTFPSNPYWSVHQLDAGANRGVEHDIEMVKNVTQVFF